MNVLFVKKSVFLLINLLLMAVPASFLSTSRLFPSSVLTCISLIFLMATVDARRRPLISVCELTPCST